MYYPNIYFLHGLGGSPEGSVKALYDAVAATISAGPPTTFHRPLLAHSDPRESPLRSYMELSVLPGSLLIGISAGGLVAAALALVIPGSTAIALSAPTHSGGLNLHRASENIYALYSSEDEVIAGRTDWQEFTTHAYDRPWLRDHSIESHIQSVNLVLAWFLRTGDFGQAVQSVDQAEVLPPN